MDINSNFSLLISKRISTRKFTDRQISPQQLQMLLDAAKRAPVGSSRYHDLHLTVVQDRDVLYKLAEAARIRRTDLKEMAEIVANVANRDELLKKDLAFDPFYGAPTVIFVSHRKQDLEPGIEFSNVSCITNYMQLQALDLGLGSCFMWYALDSMRRFPDYDNTALLKLPENFQPLLGLAVGYPAEEITERKLKDDLISVNHII